MMDAIFILGQLQEKHLAKKKNLYHSFVDLEKTFNSVPKKVVWWAMCNLGLHEWIVKCVQTIYKNTKSNVCVNKPYTDSLSLM